MKKESVEMLTAVEFAERAGVSYPTVMSWLRK
jgi:DNA-binding MurR/RpiR family transcriptional regulator